MDASALVICHPNQSNYIFLRTRYMLEDVQLMMDTRLLQLYTANIVPMPDEVRNNPDIKWDLVRDLE